MSLNVYEVYEQCSQLLVWKGCVHAGNVRAAMQTAKAAKIALHPVIGTATYHPDNIVAPVVRAGGIFQRFFDEE